MQVTSRFERGLPYVAVKGEIDHANATDVRAEIDGFLDDGETTVLLDLTDVTYIDSGGLSVFLSAVRRLRDRGWLGIINPNPDVRRLLDIVGLTVDAGFRVFDALADVAPATTVANDTDTTST